jgi:hypothetical protein
MKYLIVSCLIVLAIFVFGACGTEVEEPTEDDVEAALLEAGYIPEDYDSDDYTITVDKVKMNDDNDKATVTATVAVSNGYVKKSTGYKITFKLKDDDSWKFKGDIEADEETTYKLQGISDSDAAEVLQLKDNGYYIDTDLGTFYFWSAYEISVTVNSHEIDNDKLQDTVNMTVTGREAAIRYTFTMNADFYYSLSSNNWSTSSSSFVLETEPEIEYTNETSDNEDNEEDVIHDSSDDEDIDSSITNPSNEGKVLNIYVWNSEWRERVEEYYPNYEKINNDKGKIGDVTVNWITNTTSNGVYQSELDEALANQDEADDDDKVDIFLVEAEYATKYIDSDYTVSMADLGITDSDIEDMYQYTKDVATDSNGSLKALSWQTCAGVLFYRRSIAKAVFGTDDPNEIQYYVNDWDSFMSTATALSDNGYQITASAVDSYRVYSNNVTSKWVTDDGEINIDDNIAQWVEYSKILVNAGYTGTSTLWSSDWQAGYADGSNVFAYFGPAWLIDVMAGVGLDGDWAACAGPQSYYWGGTWICAANGTDNADLVKDIILTMTTDTDILTKICTEKGDCVNNSSVLETLADDETYGDDVLGGQNPYQLYIDEIKKISVDYISAYDQVCNDEFTGAMLEYFNGNVDYDTALKTFYSAVQSYYPELTY